MNTEAILKSKMTNEARPKEAREAKVNDIEMNESVSSIPRDVFYDDMSSKRHSSQRNTNTTQQRAQSQLEQMKSGPDMRAKPYEDKNRFRNKNHSNLSNRRNEKAENLRTPYADEARLQKQMAKDSSPSVSTSSNRSRIGVVDFTKGQRGSTGSLTRQLDDAFKRKFSQNSKNKFQKGSDNVPQELEVEDIEDDEEQDIPVNSSPMNNPKNLQKQFSQATKSQELI